MKIIKVIIIQLAYIFCTLNIRELVVYLRLESMTLKLRTINIKRFDNIVIIQITIHYPIVKLYLV